MNIIDSSGWLEYFADGPNAPFFSPPLQNTAELIVPAITIYEVRLRRDRWGSIYSEKTWRITRRSSGKIM